MASAILQTAVVNNKGLIRGNNEDNFYLDGTYMHRDKVDDGAFITGSCKNEYQLYAVCDGMGGADSGEEASFCAVRELAEQKKNYKALTSADYLTDVLRGMSEKVFDEAVARGQKSGTTIAMTIVDGDTMHVANVGDSRVYRFHNGILSQVSVDHSKVQRMVAMGLITPEQARVDPSRHIISQYLGMPKDVNVSPHIDSSAKLTKNDVYLLCSDGLTDMVEDPQIEAIIKEGKEPGDIARKLVKTALKNGGRDNVTVMILKVMQVTEDKKEAEAPQQQNSGIAKILSAAQFVVGCGLVATIADMVYYLMHR